MNQFNDTFFPYILVPQRNNNDNIKVSTYAYTHLVVVEKTLQRTTLR